MEHKIGGPGQQPEGQSTLTSPNLITEEFQLLQPHDHPWGKRKDWKFPPSSCHTFLVRTQWLYSASPLAWMQMCWKGLIIDSKILLLPKTWVLAAIRHLFAQPCVLNRALPQNSVPTAVLEDTGESVHTLLRAEHTSGRAGSKRLRLLSFHSLCDLEPAP